VRVGVHRDVSAEAAVSVLCFVLEPVSCARAGCDGGAGRLVRRRGRSAGGVARGLLLSAARAGGRPAGAHGTPCQVVTTTRALAAAGVPMRPPKTAWATRAARTPRTHPYLLLARTLRGQQKKGAWCWLCLTRASAR
jgi:hypothetical protein